ncbi:hypothetical protein CFU_2807 [Collimonas fungivorans Ter331]|uniref:Toxin SymE-like domain-containing protein n=2 Tax=Collimonas fungivorans TaxID=158899 RepID=G0A9L0_COLFT|nr:hypothetical protein CFU_2807 [Collimonas fungivorans Ter331]
MNMAKRNHTRDTRTPIAVDTQVQRPTAFFHQEDDLDALWVRLCGSTARQAGFMPETPLRIRIMLGCLVITNN